MSSISLKAARVNKGYTQGKAAELLGVSISTIKNWERGITFPRQPQIEKICKLYNIDYDYLKFDKFF